MADQFRHDMLIVHRCAARLMLNDTALSPYLEHIRKLTFRTAQHQYTSFDCNGIASWRCFDVLGSSSG